MIDLGVSYLGLPLRNPIVVGASSLTLNAEAVSRCQEAGVGAVVLKSLFEEQIKLDTSGLADSLVSEEQWHSEVFEYMEADIGMRYGCREYLNIIRTCKEAVDIPVIASLNCVSAEWWQDYARQVEAAGADALELNIAIVPTDVVTDADAVQDAYLQIARTACEAVSIPVAVKLPIFCSALPNLILRLRREGVRGFVLFNRFYRPTIDIENMRITVDSQLSQPGELSSTLRWISILAGQIDAQFTATRGVHSGADVIRALLVGADVVQVASVLYRQGVGYTQEMLRELTEWMERHGFTSIADFRGKLSQVNHPRSELFGRFQYIKGLVGIE